MRNLFYFLLFAISFMQNFIYSQETTSIKKRNTFKDILLVIHYNHPYYGSTEFIKKLYSCFPNIVFYGEQTNTTSANPVIQIQTKTGYCFTRVVADTLERFPQYQGYIFLQDDVLMNFWNFGRFKKDKIWFGISFYDGKKEIPSSWFPNFDRSKALFEFNSTAGTGWWWDTPYGNVALLPALTQLTPNDLKNLEKNIGKNKKIGMVCDMFYIPQKFKNDALRLSKVFSNVFCEIAVPMMLASLDSFENWEYLRGQWNFPTETRQYPSKEYREDADWIHPLKFSKIEDQLFAKKIVQQHTHQK